MAGGGGCGRVGRRRGREDDLYPGCRALSAAAAAYVRAAVAAPSPHSTVREHAAAAATASVADRVQRVAPAHAGVRSSSAGAFAVWATWAAAATLGNVGAADAAFGQRSNTVVDGLPSPGPGPVRSTSTAAAATVTAGHVESIAGARWSFGAGARPGAEAERRLESDGGVERVYVPDGCAAMIALLYAFCSFSFSSFGAMLRCFLDLSVVSCVIYDVYVTIAVSYYLCSFLESYQLRFLYPFCDSGCYLVVVYLISISKGMGRRMKILVQFERRIFKVNRTSPAPRDSVLLVVSLTCRCSNVV